RPPSSLLQWARQYTEQPFTGLGPVVVSQRCHHPLPEQSRELVLVGSLIAVVAGIVGKRREARISAEEGCFELREPGVERIYWTPLSAGLRLALPLAPERLLVKIEV